MRRILIAIIFFLLFSGIYAQKNEKLGYINSDSLIPYIPGRDSVLLLINAIVKTYEVQLSNMNGDYKTLYNSFKKDSSFLTKDSVKARIIELIKKKKKIKDFKTETDKDIQKRQDDLFLPLIKVAENAIADVAKENGFTYIFDTSLSNGMVLLYADKGGDIMPLVKKKLGIR